MYWYINRMYKCGLVFSATYALAAALNEERRYNIDNSNERHVPGIMDNTHSQRKNRGFRDFDQR